MSLSLLYDTRTELRRLAIAGGALAKDDIRLGKLQPQLAEAGKTAPVFGRLAGLVERITGGDVAALLEAGVLANAILATQAVHGVAGELSLPEGESAPISTTATYRMLSPLLEALTTKGGGRYEIIEEGIESKAIYDLRLLNVLTGALEDSYSAIPPLIATVLKTIGRPVLPKLLARFDPKEKGAATALRLEVIGSILGAEGSDLYRTAYEEGTPAVKLAALALMGDDPAFRPILLDAAKSRKQDVRAAAYQALSRASDAEGRAAMQAALASADYRMAIRAVAEGGNAALLDDLVAGALALLDSVQSLLDAPGSKPDIKEGGVLDRLLAALGGLAIAEEKTPPMFDVAVQALGLFLKHPKTQIAVPLDTFQGAWQDDLNEDMHSALTMAAKTVASFRSKEALDVLDEAVPQGLESKTLVFHTVRLAFDFLSPEAFYERYHTLTGSSKEGLLGKLGRLVAGKASPDEKNGKNPAREAVLNLLGRFMHSPHFEKIDPRWSDVFIRCDRVELAAGMAPLNQPAVRTYLRHKLDRTMRYAVENKSVFAGQTFHTLDAAAQGLKRMGDEEAGKAVCDWAEKHAILDFILTPSKNRYRYALPFQRNLADILALYPEQARAMLDRVRRTVEEKKPDDLHIIEALSAQVDQISRRA